MQLMLVHALVHQFRDTLRSSSEKSSLPRWGYEPARSSYPAPASELPAGEQALEDPGTEAALTIVLARAYAPPCTDCDDTTTTRREQLRSACTEEERQPCVTHVTAKARPVILIT